MTAKYKYTRGRLRLARRPRGRGTWSIRGYQMAPVTGGRSVQLTNLFASVYPDHPSKFKWRKDGPRPDMGALGRFIDCIYLSNTAALNAAQEEGLAFDLEYPSSPDAPMPCVEVRIPNLLSILSLKGSVPLPLWGRIAFMTDGRNLVPAEMLTALASVAPDMFAPSPPGTKWREIDTEGDLFRTLKLRPEQVTASMYRNHGPVGGPNGPAPLSAAAIAARDAQAQEAAPEEEFEETAQATSEDATPSAPIAETPVSRNEGRGYTELITRVETRPTPHFARRVFAQGRTVYAATSWGLDGPWHVWERDVSAMLGLGLS